MAASRTIPFFNYPALAAPYEDEILAAIKDVMKRGAYILQKDLSEFEKRAREFLGVKHFLGVADGTNALIICLHAAKIRPGDEVIVPSHTYVASAAAIHLVGAKPVLVECGPDHLVDVASIEKSITKKTKALMPVHLNGRTCDMDSISSLAAQHGLSIVEDAAQGFGSRYKGTSAGAFGLAGTYSFYPAKVLGCFGDGGGIATNNDEAAETLTYLRDHGRNSKGEFVAWGTNCRLDNLQAAILNIKIQYLPREIARRREIALAYHSALKGLDDLALPPPPEADDIHFDTFQNYELESGKRDALRAHLESAGIKTLIQWGGKAVHQLEPLGFENSLPATDRLFDRCFMLPMNPSLSDEDVEYITSEIKRFYAR